jgi:hypothetical protein
MMILLTKSLSRKAVQFCQRIITLIKHLREGHLVYRDHALVPAEPVRKAGPWPGAGQPQDAAKRPFRCRPVSKTHAVRIQAAQQRR